MDKTLRDEFTFGQNSNLLGHEIQYYYKNDMFFKKIVTSLTNRTLVLAIRLLCR